MLAHIFDYCNPVKILLVGRPRQGMPLRNQNLSNLVHRLPFKTNPVLTYKRQSMPCLTGTGPCHVTDGRDCFATPSSCRHSFYQKTDKPVEKSLFFYHFGINGFFACFFLPIVFFFTIFFFFGFNAFIFWGFCAGISCVFFLSSLAIG